VDDKRCGDPNFDVTPWFQHTLLAERCLQVLQMLSPDMCEIRDTSLYTQDVVDLPNQIKSHIPSHVQYACLHWASHLTSGRIHSGMLDLLQDFCSKQLLNWLEVMSLLGQLNGAINALQTAHRMVKIINLVSLLD
jgi:hypothetical protein